jgi:hypothetical protein
VSGVPNDLSVLAKTRKAAQVLKMSSFKRDFAARLDVDPYSSNIVLGRI